MAGIVLLTHALLIDGTGREPVEDATVVVEGDLIKDVLTSGRVGPLAGSVTTLDLRGRTLMPGLTDAHVHVCAVEGNTAEQHRVHPPSLIVAKALRRIEQCLAQGFTTVRDAGGADYGFREAVASGLYPGPRLLVSGRASRRPAATATSAGARSGPRPSTAASAWSASIADGADEVRRAARENLRRDVDQIKIMASGGAMSPSDELDTTQYTVAEMRAAVEEAQAVGKYVLAHAYSDTAVRRAIEAGVRSIEHGNLITRRRARPSRTRARSWCRRWSPTRPSSARASATASAITRSEDRPGARAERAGPHLRLQGRLQDRLGLRPPRRHGGPAPVEFELKGQVMKPMEVLLSATKVNAELFRMDDRIGTVEPGKYADLIVVAGNPLDDLRLFQNPEHLHLMMKGGAVYRQRL